MPREQSLINRHLLEIFMYKRLVAVYAVGFGLGLWLTGTLFESVLSPLGNPITVADTMLDWNSIVTTWKYFGLAWFVGGALLFLMIRALEKKSPGSDVYSSKEIVGNEGSSEVNKRFQGVRDAGSFGAVEKNLESYRKQLEELERELMERGLDISRLKTRTRNRDSSESEKE